MNWRGGQGSDQLETCSRSGDFRAGQNYYDTCDRTLIKATLGVLYSSWGMKIISQSKMSKTKKVIPGANCSVICHAIHFLVQNISFIYTQRTLHELKSHGCECFYKVGRNYFSAWKWWRRLCQWPCEILLISWEWNHVVVVVVLSFRMNFRNDLLFCMWECCGFCKNHPGLW